MRHTQVLYVFDGSFWYTQEYAKPNTRLGELAGWATKIVQVKVSAGNLGKEVAAGEEIVPDKYALIQNNPNPFNPSTEISFKLPEASRVILKIYNSSGLLIYENWKKQSCHPGI